MLNARVLVLGEYILVGVSFCAALTCYIKVLLLCQLALTMEVSVDEVSSLVRGWLSSSGRERLPPDPSHSTNPFLHAQKGVLSYIAQYKRYLYEVL